MKSERLKSVVNRGTGGVAVRLYNRASVSKGRLNRGQRRGGVGMMATIGGVMAGVCDGGRRPKSAAADNRLNKRDHGIRVASTAIKME